MTCAVVSGVRLVALLCKCSQPQGYIVQATGALKIGTIKSAAPLNGCLEDCRRKPGGGGGVNKSLGQTDSVPTVQGVSR